MSLSASAIKQNFQISRVNNVVVVVVVEETLLL